MDRGSDKGKRRQRTSITLLDVQYIVYSVCMYCSICVLYIRVQCSSVRSNKLERERELTTCEVHQHRRAAVVCGRREDLKVIRNVAVLSGKLQIGHIRVIVVPIEHHILR